MMKTTKRKQQPFNFTNKTMNKHCLRFILPLLMLICISLSCKVTKPYQQPGVNTGSLYRGETGTDTVTLATMPWDSLFTDTTLKSLIREGLNNNLNLKTAIQKIVEAQAALGQTKAAFYPSLSGNASVTRAEQSVASLDFPPGFDVSTLTTTYTLGLSSSWEAAMCGGS
jgi:outer membrane protein TolC